MITNFKQLESAGTMKRADARKCQVQHVHEEPGFNLRDLEALDADGRTFAEQLGSLVEHIAAGGAYPPLEVRVRPEGGVYVIDGHRRRLALLQLIAEGRLPADPKDGKFWVSVVPFVGNDAERLLRVMTSNERQELSSIERARGYQRLRAFDWSVEYIAKMVGKSRSHVEQLLTLAGANSDVQKLLKAGVVSASVAVATVRKHGEKAGTILQAAQAESTTGKVKPKQIVDDVPAEVSPNKKVRDAYALGYSAGMAQPPIADRLVASLRACATDEQPTHGQLDTARKLLAEIDAFKP